MLLNISTNINSFDIKNIKFNNTIKNKIIKCNNSFFTGIIHKNDNIMLNNACFYFKIKNPLVKEIENIDRITEKKFKCIITNMKDKNILKKLLNIEKQILNKYASLYNKGQEKVYSFYNLDDDNTIHFKYYINAINTITDNNKNFVKKICLNNETNIKKHPEEKIFAIKISGVWESNNKIGISYKICLL